MDRNTILALALSMVVFALWLGWQGERHPPKQAEELGESQRSREAGEVGPKAENRGRLGVVADVEERRASEASGSPRGEAPGWSKTPVWSRTFTQPLYEAQLTNRGATLKRWSLQTYMERTPAGERPVELVGSQETPQQALTTPFLELGLGDLSDVPFLVVEENDDGASFELERDGIRIRKVYTFDRDSYTFGLGIEVLNQTNRTIAPRFEVNWPARTREGRDFTEQSFAAHHAGKVERTPVASIGVPGFFDRMMDGGGEEGPPTWRGDVDWAGIDNRYFLAVLLPDRVRDARARFLTVERGVVGTVALDFEPVEIPPGKSVHHQLRGFVGPKEPARLEAVATHLGDAVGRGWAWIAPLTRFFEWMLQACYAVIPNYGVAIILLTILVRLATMPVMARQMKSMERMRALQPQLKELQAQFADDRQKQSEAMMKLYRQEGVNPLGGCLPMLLQFPVFIGLFYALQSSIDLRHAPFMGWIDDLSSPEALFVIPGIELPFRVLPIVMGGSMILQQKLTPTTIDPAQARMMMTVMPIMFTVLFYRFPSGLVLYWMISNFIGIAHQLWVGRRMRAAKT